MSNHIDAKGNIDSTHVSATLTLGDATLTLIYPRDDEQANDDMVQLILHAEDYFTEVLEALAAKAAEVEQNGA